MKLSAMLSPRAGSASVFRNIAQSSTFPVNHRNKSCNGLARNPRAPEKILYPEILTKKNHVRSRILFFGARIPYPVRSGSDARTLSLLKFLSTLDCDIVLVYPEFEEVPPKREQEILKYVSCLHRMKTHSPKGFLTSRIYRILEHVKLILGVQVNPLYNKSRFKAMLSSCHYETVFTDYFFSSLWIKAAKPNALTIVDTKDVAFQRAQRKIDVTYSAFKKSIANIMLALFKQWELRLYNRFDKILAISPYDYQVFKKNLNNTTRLLSIPIPVDLEYFHPGNESEIVKNKILFIGTGNLANTDAFKYFITEIFPLIRRELPAARFSMAGNNPSREQIELANIMENVEVLGFQEDLREQYKSAEVVVCPLRIGSGMKAKVGEAAAMGKAIVMTSVSAEGYNMRNNEECVVADDPEEFAAAVVGLLRSQEERRAMELKARLFAEQNHNEATLYRELGEILTGKIDEPKKASRK